MLRKLVLLALLAYPFLIYFSLDRLGPLVMGTILVVLLLLRMLADNLLRQRGLMVLLIVGCTVFLLALYVTGDLLLIKFYPVVINLVLLAMFATTLFFPPTLIERGLRLAGRDVPVEAPPYLWWVTLAWSAFFLVNATISAWTALRGSLEVWTLYNGLLSYGLIALGFVIERITRILYQRRTGMTRG